MRHYVDVPLSAWMRISGALLISLVPASMPAQEEEKFVEADLTVSKDYGVTMRVTTPMVKEAALKDLTEADFARMSLDDIRLQSGYIIVIRSVRGDPMRAPLTGGIAAARGDLYRRGNEAAPVLLRLLRDNPHSSIEAAIMVKIEQIPGIDAAPFVEQARLAVRERGMTMNPWNADCIAKVLVRNGDLSNWDLLKKWAVDRPYVESTVKKALVHGAWVQRQAYGPTLPPVMVPQVGAKAAPPVPAAPPQR